MFRTHTCGELRISDVNKQVTLSGWVQRSRKMGGMAFFDIRDRYGNAHGGHLVEGTKVLLTVDVIIAEIEGMVMGRQFDENLEVPIFAPRQV